MVFEIILMVLLIVSFYTIFNLFKKLESYELANEEYDAWILRFNNKIREILVNIKTLDSKNIFESDDEVGSVYEKISETIKELEELKND